VIVLAGNLIEASTTTASPMPGVGVGLKYTDLLMMGVSQVSGVKSTHLSFLLLISIGSVFAQQPYPSGIRPIEGTLTLRFQSGYQSKCTMQTQPLPDNSVAQGSANYEVFQDTNGHQQLLISLESGMGYFRIYFDIEKDGLGISNKKPTIQTNTSEGMPDILLSEFKNRLSTVGKPISQHSVVSRNLLCNEFGKTITHVSSSGSFNIIGTAIIDGKESVVIGGERESVCSINKQQVTIKVKGWDSFDKVSGLPANASWTAHMDGQPSLPATTTTYVCSVSRK